MPGASFWWAHCNPKEKEQVLKDVGKEAAEKFAAMFEAGVEASGFRQPPPAERLAAYMTRPPEIWAALRAEFPKQFHEDLMDFGNLAEKAGEDEQFAVKAMMVSFEGQGGAPALP